MRKQEGPHWNLLVLSDLHLGDQLPGEPRARVRQSAHFLAHHFGSFLDHYATQREQGLPWRLVIAGDMIDFMRIHIPAPQASDPGPQNPGPETRWQRPPSHLKGALQKLDQVFRLHHHTFERLGHFLLEGHELIIVTGNHDAELNWIEVQDTFRAQLQTLMGLVSPELPVDAFAQNVRFMPWFYYEPERIYIEHGHLYDRYCNVENALSLDENEESKEKELLSFSHFASHYQYRSEEAFSGLPLEHLDQWTIWEMARWVVTRPARQKYLLLLQILGLIWRLVSTAWRAQYRHASALPPAQKQAIFRQIAEEQALPVEAIEPLQQFITPPIHSRLFDTIQSLYLDRMALVAVTVLITVVSLAAPWAPMLRAAILTFTATGFVAAYLYLANRHPVAHTAPALLAAATRIASYLEAPLIVFGHSHKFERHWLCQNQLYINLGSWLAPAENAHTAPAEPSAPKAASTTQPARLPNTPPCSMPSVQPFDTPYLILTYQDRRHKSEVARWQSHTPHPTREVLPQTQPTV